MRGRKGAQRLAVTNAGTIPDRGLYGVFLPDGTRVGELDEEMVYESRPGETFLLGASTWRIEDITFERVVVTPAPGQPGKMPFWHGDGPGRPLELGRALGAFTPGDADADRARRARTTDDTTRLDELAARNLVQYIDDQREATGVVPTTRRLSSSDSGTRSAIGGSVSSRRSVLRYTRLGAWHYVRGSPNFGAPTSR